MMPSASNADSTVYNDQNPTRNEDSNVPIDHGWAWVILVASTVINTLYAGVLKSFGIFFIEILEVYGGHVSTTSLISGLQFMVYCVTNVPVMMILLRYQSVRTCQIAGIIFSSLAYLLSSLATSLHLLILFQSLLNGISIALIVPTGIVLVARYFRRRIGFANGVLMAGLSLGGLVLPPLIQLLVREYTLHGALLLTSAIVLNALPAAVLQRPPEFYRRHLRGQEDKYRDIKHTDATTDKCTHHELVSLLVSSDNTLLKKESVHSSDLDLNIEVKDKMKKCIYSKTDSKESAKSYPFLDRTNLRTHKLMDMEDKLIARSMPDSLHSCSKNHHPNNARENQYKVKESLYVQHISSLSAFECTNVSDLTFPNERDTIQNRIPKTLEAFEIHSRCCNTATWKSCWTNCKILLTNKVFILYVCFYTMGTIGNETITIYLPAFANETGVDSSNVAVLISIHSVCDFLGRIVTGYMADLRWIKRHRIILLTQIMTALLPQFTYFYNTFPLLAAFSASFGCLSGVVFAISSPILKDVVGESRFAAGVALAILVKGLLLAGIIPFMGFLRDVTHTYHTTFHCMGATSLIAVVVLIVFDFVIPKHIA